MNSVMDEFARKISERVTFRNPQAMFLPESTLTMTTSAGLQNDTWLSKERFDGCPGISYYIQ
jgi:hypothetical protein